MDYSGPLTRSMQKGRKRSLPKQDALSPQPRKITTKESNSSKVTRKRSRNSNIDVDDEEFRIKKVVVDISVSEEGDNVYHAPNYFSEIETSYSPPSNQLQLQSNASSRVLNTERMRSSLGSTQIELLQSPSISSPLVKNPPETSISPSSTVPQAIFVTRKLELLQDEEKTFHEAPSSFSLVLNWLPEYPEVRLLWSQYWDTLIIAMTLAYPSVVVAILGFYFFGFISSFSSVLGSVGLAYVGLLSVIIISFLSSFAAVILLKLA